MTGILSRLQRGLPFALSIQHLHKREEFNSYGHYLSR